MLSTYDNLFGSMDNIIYLVCRCDAPQGLLMEEEKAKSSGEDGDGDNEDSDDIECTEVTDLRVVYIICLQCRIIVRAAMHSRLLQADPH